MNTRTKIETVEKMRVWLMEEILDGTPTPAGLKLIQRVRGVMKLRDMVMLVMVWCDSEGKDPIVVLREFGIERNMVGKEGNVVMEALHLLGKNFSAKYL